MRGDRSLAGSADRLHSLDVFRGITIAAMVLVNNPGSWSQIYPPLRHALWHGCTPTDLVFPFFLWIVGVSTALSHARFASKGGTSRGFLLKTSRRAAIVFLFGLFLAGFPFGLFGDHRFSLSELRIPGVLQRIAVCQWIAVAIHLVTDLRKKIVATVALLLGSYLLMRFCPVPGYGAGDWSPDGNLARYVDSIVLAGHTWKSAIRPGFDPEGIVSTIPAIATVMLGILAGLWIETSQRASKKVAGLAGCGIVVAALGYALDPIVPINKPLWTSSYCLFTAGLAATALAALVAIVDRRRHSGDSRDPSKSSGEVAAADPSSRNRGNSETNLAPSSPPGWTWPFRVFGTNAMFAYVVSGIFARTFGLLKTTTADGRTVSWQRHVFANVFQPIGDLRMASLLYAVAFSIVVFLPVLLLWKKRWFLKV